MNPVNTNNQAPFAYSDLAEIFGERATANIPKNLTAKGVSTDTRTLERGNIFVALVGERFDGHTLAKEALAKGAAAVVAEDRIKTGFTNTDAPLLLVPNTLQALGAMAHFHRKRFSLPILAVAGSAGKTTTKEMAAFLLGEQFSVLKTEGNFNNQVGVPLTLLRLTEKHTAAVVEIGTNEPGEIETLSAIVAPTHGIITNIGKEHLEKLIDEDGVEREETALLRYFAEHGGTAFINMNDARLRKYRRSGWVHYGLKNSLQNSLQSNWQTDGISFDVDAAFTLEASNRAVLHVAFAEKNIALTAHLQSIGSIGARNALAAAAVGLGLGMSAEKVVRGLEGFRAETSDSGYGRMVTETLNISENRTITLLNDCYNANPTSMYAALETLQSAPKARKAALLGDMRELGSSSAKEHDALLTVLKEALWLDMVVLTGAEMFQAFQRFSQEFSETSKIVFAENASKASEILTSRLHSGDVLLVKGSRGVRLEEALTLLRGQANDEF